MKPFKYKKLKGLKRILSGKCNSCGVEKERLPTKRTCADCLKEKRRNSKPLTLEEAKRVFRYNPETGELFSIQDDGSYKLRNYKNPRGDVVVNVRYKKYYAHRIIFMLEGIDPEGSHVDHIDGNPSNNRRDNLRLVSNQENQKNKQLPKNNKSGVMGVYKVGDKWLASIRIDGRTIHIGSYNTKEDASDARKQEEEKYGFHSNHGRKPEQNTVEKVKCA
jgi:hypothetical protein